MILDEFMNCHRMPVGRTPSPPQLVYFPIPSLPLR
jgi:hypothetical protein